ncbi:MAG: caspase family protein [Candidatus Tectomicrobia bacterium]|nr:caspase family protein [Candidatus Tectomicrobia bacterium]
MRRIQIAVLLVVLFVPFTAYANDLISAIREGNSAKVNALLNGGADVNAKDKDDRTALMYAAAKGDPAIVQALLDRGAEVNVKDKDGRTALIYAAPKGDFNVMKALLDKGADVNAADARGGGTALIYAARKGDPALVKALLEKGADVNAAQAGTQGTALTNAAENGHIDVVKLLLDYRADVTKKARKGTAEELAQVKEANAQGKERKTYGDIVRLLRGETLDREPPTITIASNRALQAIKSEDVRTTIQGQATDSSGIAKITVNGEAASVDAAGKFVAEVLLNEGNNTIVVKATDIPGNDAEKILTIFRPPAGSGPPGAERRKLALVIGNSSYEVGPLANPVNDATDMAEALKNLGFEVTLLSDAKKRDMETAIDEFRSQLSSSKAVGLFYYAGHGLQVSGDNYLIPIGARINEELQVKYEAVPAGYVLDSMNQADNGLNIVILDACRNNPFKRSWSRSVSTGEGLAPPAQSATGTLIAYATDPGSVAADGSGRNGTYTKYLLRYLNTPGLSVEQVFKQVRIEVMRETDGKQRPWETSSLTGEFYFTGKAGTN